MALSFSKKFDLEVVRCISINYVYIILDIIFIGIMK